MKKLAFFLVTLSLAILTQAQSYQDIGNKIILQQYDDAKKDIDKRITNEKFASKPDAYILKAAIYAALATKDGAVDKDKLIAEAETAYAKYKEMDPTLALITDPIYREGVIKLYQALYSRGIESYRAKSWEPAYTDFKKVVDLSDVLIDKKVLNITMDTTSVLLAGFTAENSSHKDEAAKYYSKLANNKVGGDGNDFVYRFLVLYSYEKNDMASFEKYRQLGKELYPNNEYFDYDKTDFAVGLAKDFDTKVKALNTVLAEDPNNYKANVTLAQLIFDTLNAGGDATKPANAAELESKMVQTLNKAAELKPDDENVLLVLGDHYIAKAEQVNDERSAHVKAMQARTKPGTKPSKEDVAKRDELDKKYGDVFELARVPYEKAASLFSAKKASLTSKQKQQYRNIAGYLGDIYNYKKVQAKANPADAAKYEAEAKKWNDLYDTLR